MYQGDIAVGQVLYFHFTTQFSGLPTSLLGTPVLSVFKDATATPCTTVLSVGAGGLVVDLNSVTGLNSVAVNTAADGTFYATGHDFSVVITTGTVGGVSAIGYKVASFSINNRTPLRPTTAGRTADIAATGEVGLDFDNVHDATGAHTLTNITVPVTTGVTGLTTATIAAALMDLADGVETGLTPRNALRLIAAALAGKLSGATTASVKIKNAIADDKTRITATVDADGNRTAITTDLT
jgi:hypothetical protein